MKIRFNTFETNSSSAHTFVLRDNNTWTTDEEISEYIESVYENMDNKLPKGYVPTTSFFGDNEYGRGYCLLSNWYDKMSYMIAMFGRYPEKLSDIKSALKERIPNMVGIIVKDTGYDDDDMNLDVNKTPYYEENWSDFECFGSIDHQSTDVGDQFLDAMKKEELYKNMSFKEICYHVIFCNKFVIITDSDETDTFMNMYEQGFFKNTDFKYVLYDNYQYDPKTNESSCDPIFMNFEDYMHRYDKEEDDGLEEIDF